LAISDAALPLSVKGILGPPGRVALLLNERDEWELPGGRLERHDVSPEACLAREIEEELRLVADVGSLVHSWRYEPLPGRYVQLVAYRCRLVGEWPDTLAHSHEHHDVGLFLLEDLEAINLPQGYRDAIAQAGIRGRR